MDFSKEWKNPLGSNGLIEIMHVNFQFACHLLLYLQNLLYHNFVQSNIMFFCRMNRELKNERRQKQDALTRSVKMKEWKATEYKLLN